MTDKPMTLSDNSLNEIYIYDDIKRKLDESLVNSARFLAFIQMKGLEEEFASFEGALDYFERAKELYKEGDK